MGLALLLSLAVVATGVAAPPIDEAPLELRQPLTRSVEPGVVDALRIDVAAGEYVEIASERPYRSLGLELLDPHGRVVAATLGEPPNGSSLRLAAVIADPGTHLLTIANDDVAMLESGAPARRGRCRIELLERRPAVDGDADRVDAFAALDRVRRTGAAISGDAVALRGARDELAAIAARFDALAAFEGAALCFHTLAQLDGVAHDDAAAARSAEAAVAAWRAAGRRREEGRARSEVGLIAYAAYQREAARASYDEALAIHEEVGDVEWIAETLDRRGWFERWCGDRRAAIATYERCLPLRVEAADWHGEIVTLTDLGVAHLELGEVAAAAAWLQRARDLAAPARDGTSFTKLLTVSGWLELRVGDFAAAAVTQQRSLAQARASRDRRGEAQALHNLGRTWVELGELAQARAASEQALVIVRETGQRSGETAELLFLAQLRRHEGDLDQAIADAAAALALAEAIHDRAFEAAARRVLGECSAVNGDLERGREELEAALALERELGMKPAESSTLVWLANVVAAQGDLEAAMRLSEQALAIVEAFGLRSNEAVTRSTLAAHAFAIGQRETARVQLEQALALGESLRRRMPQDDWRSSYFTTQLDRYALLLDVLLEGHDGAPEPAAVARAFEVSEAARARSLLDLLSEAKVDVRAGADATLLAQERGLTQELHFAAAALDQLVQGAATAAQAAAASAKVEAISNQLREIETRLRASSPRFAALSPARPSTAAAIQHELLDDETVLLEFAFGREATWLFAVTRQSLEAHRLAPRAALEASASAAIAAMTARSGRIEEEGASRQARIAAADAQTPARLAELRRLLLGPVEGALQGEWRHRRLVVVAPGRLAALPFAALVAQEVVLLPSASVLAIVRSSAAPRPSGVRPIAVLADPVFERDDPRLTSASKGVPSSSATAERMGYARLPFSGEEAARIAALVEPGRVRRFEGFDATRDAVVAGTFADCGIVHFATHGLVDVEKPEHSGMVLSLLTRDGAEQDGLLCLADLFRLRMPADLVVLSACKTALGRDIPGEGLVGLTRAFFHAGASRVVASLWEVDDLATAELMRRFYRGVLQEGRSPAAALRLAQDEMAAQERFAVPYWWAGFVLQGEWR